MILLSAAEVIGIAIVTLAVGYIFSGFLPVKRDPFSFHSGFDFEALKFSILVSAPAVILHEMGHKFVALAFGIPAVFQVYWGGLGLALVLKMIQSPFLIIAPAYVVVPGSVSAIHHFLISFSGPLMNLVLWLGSLYALKNVKLSPRAHLGVALSARMNKFLFIFNLVPIPPLDGFAVFRSLLEIISSFF